MTARWLVVALGVLALPHRALAQSTLDQAENAYSEIDFPRAIELADQALTEGGHSPDEVARLYELLGLSHAAERQEAEAREAYKKLIALRPDAEVDTNLAPRLRSPFLEAKGFWASRTGFTVAARVVPARGAVRVELSDPLGMATTVRVLSRDHALPGPMEANEMPAEGSVLVPIPVALEAPQVDYVVQILDPHGNRLAELGTEDEPRVFGEARVTPTEPVEPGRGGIPVWVWVVGGVVVAGVAALAIGLAIRDEPITLQSAVTFE